MRKPIEKIFPSTKHFKNIKKKSQRGYVFLFESSERRIVIIGSFHLAFNSDVKMLLCEADLNEGCLVLDFVTTFYFCKFLRL